jgi:hypothetical protein
MIFSPNKPKNGGITAGIARAGAGKDSATGNGVDDSDEVRPPGFLQILFLVLRVHYATRWLPLSVTWIWKIYFCAPLLFPHTFISICKTRSTMS